MKYREFTKPTCRTLKAELEQALAKFGPPVNVDFEVGRMSFTSSEATIKITAIIAGELTEVQKAVARFTEFQHGDEVEVSGLGLCTMESYHRKRRKYPFLVKTSAGKIYKTGRDSVRTSSTLNLGEQNA